MIDSRTIEQAVELSDVIYSTTGEFHKQDGLQCLGFVRDVRTSTELACFLDKQYKKLYVVFRGTDEIRDWVYNLNVLKTSFVGLTMHAGYVQCLKSVLYYLDKEFLKYNNYTVILTGHSKGGAVAEVCQAYCDSRSIKNECITFGAPPVFYTDKYSTKTYRFVNEHDPVVRAGLALGLTHGSNELHLGKSKALSALRAFFYIGEWLWSCHGIKHYRKALT